MKRTHSLILIFVLCLLSISAFAAHKIQKEEGKPLQVQWEDGRIAEYAPNSSGLWKADIPFQLSENTCSNVPALNCYFRAYLKIRYGAFYWRKHPQREGKIVQGKFGDLLFPLNSPFFLSLDFRLQKHPLTSDMPVEEIVCDNYDWLPGSGKEAPKRFLIPRWNSEKMEQNPETGLMENRTVGGGINVELESTEKNTLAIQRLASMFGPQKTLVQNVDILAWILPLSNGEQCQISIKANTTKFNNEIIEFYYKTLAEPQPKEYLWGADAWSKEYFGLGYFLTAPEGVNPQ